MVYPFSAGCEVQRFIRFIRFFHEPDSRENCHCRDTWLMMVFKESEIMDEKELRRQVQYLARKGFSSSDIWKQVRKYQDEP